MNTETPHTKSEKLVVPKLRFKEFATEWKKSKLSSLNIKVIDGDRGKNYPNGGDFSVKGYCLFLNAKNVTKNGFSFEETSFITKEKDLLLRKGKLSRFDIVLTTRGSVGHIAFFDENVPVEILRINSGMVLIRVDSELIYPKYLNKYLISNQIQNEIKKISFGSAQPQLTVGEIIKLKIAFPTLPEQQKIAGFLTAVDTKIQQLTQKKELLEQYKKGVMQQLFSQQLRFKQQDGNDYPDWEQKRLSQLLVRYSENNKDEEFGIDDILSLSSKYGIVDRKELLQDTYSKVNHLNYIKTRINDFVYAKSISSNAPYGVFKANLIRDGLLSTLYFTFKVKENASPLYLEYYFSDPYRANNFLKKFVLVGDRYITADSDYILSGKIQVPTLYEQHQIANYLSALDTKIENVAQQIAQTQQFKKGLLQQLFV